MDYLQCRRDFKVAASDEGLHNDFGDQEGEENESRANDQMVDVEGVKLLCEV